MNKRTLSYILIVVGAIGLLISLTADITGLGGDPLNFGWKQILGSVVGVVIIIAGVVLLVTKHTSSQAEVSQDKIFENSDE